MKRSIWPALALSIAALGPAACGGGEQTAPADPDAPEGITVANGRMFLPPVAGNPAAIYFDVSNAGDQDAMIRSAHVQGAETAMLHQMSSWNGQASMNDVLQQPVPAGETVSFEPAGLHVMASGLSETLVAGGTTEVTLTFMRGDKVSFPVEILAAGDER